MYQIGERVIHRNYGPSTVIGIEEKQLGKKKKQYYVVEASQVMLWVPLDATESIRYPFGKDEFQNLLAKMNGAGEELPDHHLSRADVLKDRLKSRTMADICSVIHDLTSHSRSHSLTKNDNACLQQAQDLLLDEWVTVMGTPREVARQELNNLLQGIPAF